LNIEVIHEERHLCSYCGNWDEAELVEVWRVDSDYQTSGPQEDGNYWFFSEEPESVNFYRSVCCGEEAYDEENKFYACGECDTLYRSEERTEAVQCCR